MKKGGVLLMHSFFLVLVCVCGHASSDVEGPEEEPVGPGPLPPLKLGHSICALKQDGGLCKATMERFYFSIYTRQCESFDYGGCGGNENNFLTLEECREKCIVKDIPFKRKRGKLQQGKPAFCLLKEDPGICRGFFSRYFYNRESENCEKFKYGGCLGNENNFMSLEDCQNTCQDRSPLSSLAPSEEESVQQQNSSTYEIPIVFARSAYFRGPSYCQIPADRGNCSSTERRFYFQHSTGKCLAFNYSGCGGNKNKFYTKRSCIMVCKKGLAENQKWSDLIKTKRKREKMAAKPKHDAIIFELV
ncbi:tissue factor pathway inhibitor isoform X2 [Rhinatrema bivittatum]|nr:tissue factor pathway inhibitor isoform X2 [Rhinatrema bivittatum]